MCTGLRAEAVAKARVPLIYLNPDLPSGPELGACCLLIRFDDAARLARSTEGIGTKSQGGMSCGMLWYFLQQSCCLARHWFPTTPSPGAVVAAALEAEVVASMVAHACMAVVDTNLRDVLTRATRSRDVRVGRVVPSRVVRVTVDRVTRVARSRDGRAIIPEPPGEPRRQE